MPRTLAEIDRDLQAAEDLLLEEKIHRPNNHARIAVLHQTLSNLWYERQRALPDADDHES